MKTKYKFLLLFKIKIKRINKIKLIIFYYNSYYIIKIS
jgi:hypothetical protein